MIDIIGFIVGAVLTAYALKARRELHRRKRDQERWRKETRRIIMQMQLAESAEEYAIREILAITRSADRAATTLAAIQGPLEQLAKSNEAKRIHWVRAFERSISEDAPIHEATGTHYYDPHPELAECRICGLGPENHLPWDRYPDPGPPEMDYFEKGGKP